MKVGINAIKVTKKIADLCLDYLNNSPNFLKICSFGDNKILSSIPIITVM